jgi:hypothetical protein
VTVPKESIWQDLRRNCLDAIPRGSRTSPTSPVSLARWRERGYYTVRATNAKRFELIASTEDFGSALLTDVECLLDNAIAPRSLGKEAEM